MGFQADSAFESLKDCRQLANERAFWIRQGVQKEGHMTGARPGIPFFPLLVSFLYAAALPARSAPPPADFYPAPVTVRDHGHNGSQHWVRYAQCQMKFDVAENRVTSIPIVADPGQQEQRIMQCVDAATAERVDVLILPEVAVALPSDVQRRVFAKLTDAAKRHRMLIVAGSYYDSQRRSRIAYFGPSWVEQGFKIKPSRFEVSPLDGHGMADGASIYVLRSGFGNIATITCVDLISDEVQAAVRRLIDERKIDVLININYNPASWEFLIEANSIARRHPVFVSITNAVPTTPVPPCDALKDNDNGYCYGNSALFASLTSNYGLGDVLKSGLIPDHFMTRPPDVPRHSEDPRALPYDYLVADVGAFKPRMLLYDLNMWLPRVSYDTTAPDQGYPTVRNIKFIDLPSR